MIYTYKPKLTILQQQILRLFFIKAGKSLNARDIARALKVSPPAVAKALPLLEKENFLKIKKDKESKRWLIELNRDSQRIIWLKRADNFKQIYESGLVQFFYDNFHSATIILFGSYAFGEDTINSDVDIAIIGAKEKKVNLKNFEELLGREIILNYYDSFKTIIKNLKENILSGITLKGAIEL
ncbi:MAG: nucleotidyltransferase domain-containing protein [Candidatus Pacearchaeota archaeon]|nr:nucleotidyltransferase domain-containing protein [Candidatus Pacearchaeota archaeon]